MVKSICEEYLEYQKQFENKYGKKTIVFIEVGVFYNIYGIDNKQYKFGKVKEITDILNIQITRQRKAILENSFKNPLTAGVPNHSIEKYVKMLLNESYTVILVGQTESGKNVNRDIKKIYSPGTNIDFVENIDSNYLCSIYLESIQNKINKTLCYGISFIDLPTGQSLIFEGHTQNNNFNEIFRLLNIYNPKETLIYTNKNFENKTIIEDLELKNKCYHMKSIPDEYLKHSYQQTFLEKIYKNNSILSIIEFLDLEFLNFGLISFIAMLQFSYEHDNNILLKIDKPKIMQHKDHLILTNDSIYQLDLINRNKGKFSNLVNILDHCHTGMGKRHFKNKILNPITNINDLQNNYDIIEQLLQKHPHNQIEYYKYLENDIKKICDLERYHRKIELGRIQPSEFGILDDSYNYICSLFKKLHEYPNLVKNLNLDTTQEKFFYDYLNDYKNKIIIDEFLKYNLQSIKNSIFAFGHNKELDHLQKQTNQNKQFLEIVKNKLNSILDKNYTKDLVRIEFTEKDGYILTSTVQRIKMLKTNIIILKQKNKFLFTVTIENKLTNIRYDDLEFIQIGKSNHYKIQFPKLNDISDNIISLTEQISILCIEQFNQFIDSIYQKYSNTYKYISEFISKLDVYVSNAKTARKYNYHKPIICNDQNDSYLKIKNLRHPIIERIQNDLEYIPNDIELGTSSNKGCIIFGVNSSGKSSLMKAVGLSIVMAQSGLYVPASNFIYNPYEKIYTRILNNDNIFKGQSTFTKEILELRTIINQSCNNSLIIGDEICSGTESVSALSIITSTILYLIKNKSSFMFTSHLHKLFQLERLKNNDQLKFYNLSVIYDSINKSLIYNRKLKSGIGETLYGLEVCKAMKLDPEFLKLAYQIRGEIMNINPNILNNKTSLYNKNIYMNKCSIIECNNDAIDVHHIKYQSEANQHKFINHFHKNSKFNLVPLCKECHIKAHNGELNIKDYKLSLNGKFLDYNHEKKKKNKKYFSEQLDYLLSLKKLNLSQKLACNKAENEKNIKISPSTLSKIWNQKY